MPDIAGLAQHARGEHRDSPAKGCPACDAVRTAERSEAGAQRAEKGRKRPPSAKKQGRCEHCGVPTAGGRFAPGHDAKLKRDLALAARCNRPNDWMELMIRGWTHLVKEQPHSTVIEQARANLAAMGGNEREVWLETRNALRRTAG